ncbi:MAG TPA: imidazolonepropionase [Alphaproteobacteria bacterium]|nr:imidazolonepropionase [Alphaproteobacteria bacterium]
MAKWDRIWINASVATMEPEGSPYGIVRDGAIAAAGGRIAFAGARSSLPGRPEDLAREVIDCKHAWITPGLVDCHTHIVFGGNRAHEFELRLKGASYEEIARAGGGIRSTVAATRAASEDELYRAARGRIARSMAEGVTTLEIKSGYGLSTEHEIKMLRVARRLGRDLALDIVTTFLGAHAVPPEYEGRQRDYVALVCRDMIPAVASERLADAADAFCEKIAFTPEETAAVFESARSHGLPIKLHADQLSDLGGAALAARFKALSADHLEYTSEAGVEALSASKTVAVLLPGAFYYLRERQHPPLDALRRHNVPIALASDCNPGSSPALSLLLMLNLACTLFRMTPEEALAGVTRSGATALGLGQDRGRLAVGMRADMAVWQIDHPAELAYWLGNNPCIAVVKDGNPRALI